jgi:hypothetical protein
VFTLFGLALLGAAGFLVDRLVRGYPNLRARFAHEAQAFLAPGEQVQATILATTGGEGWNRIVIATDRRLVLAAPSGWTRTHLKHLRDADRRLQLGPLEGRGHRTTVFGRAVWILPEYYPDARLADEQRPWV